LFDLSNINQFTAFLNIFACNIFSTFVYLNKRSLYLL